MTHQVLFVDVLFLFQEFYNGNSTILVDSSQTIWNTVSTCAPKRIFVCTGPANYTTCRRNMAICSAWQNSNISIYGFDILHHYLDHHKRFFLYKNLIWIYENNIYSMHNINNLNSDLSGFIGNVQFLNSDNPQDCSINAIYDKLNLLQNPLSQIYSDSFKWRY